MKTLTCPKFNAEITYRVYKDWGKNTRVPLISTLFFSDASLSNDNPVMAFHDMAGVFYAILFGQFVSLLVLLGELAWEALKDVKESKVNCCLDFEY